FHGIDKAVVDTWIYFLKDTAATDIYTLSLHDALPIFRATGCEARRMPSYRKRKTRRFARIRSELSRDDREGVSRPRSPVDSVRIDRKSTRLNSSHLVISYAVFCLKKKKLNVFIHPNLG